MPTRPAERSLTGRGRHRRLVLAGALLGLLGTGCASGTDVGASSDPAPVPPASPGPSSPLSPTTPATPTAPAGVGAPTDLGAPAAPSAQLPAPPDVVAGLQEALTRRAAAVLSGDETVYRAGLALGDASFRAVQEVWLTNLRQLPLQAYSLVPDPASVVRAGPGAYWVNVEVTVQLQDFDTATVTGVDRYLLRSARPQGRLRLASTTDAEWEARNAVRAPLWETTPLVVRSTPGVLGLFDARSEPAAGPLLASVRQGIDAVSAVVPYPWSRSVVVVALSEDGFLRGLPDLPGAAAGAPAPVPDAVAFGVGEGADTRLALHPRLLGRDGPGRDRLLRHELTHVALGARDDHAPLWLSEGLAELVSVQSDPTGRRRLQPEAVAAAEAGIRDLPPQVGFHDRDVAAHYGVAWFACEYVAATAGPAAPWALLDQLEALGAQSPQGVADSDQQDAVLTSLVGVNARTLARKAGKLLLATEAAASVPAPAPVAAAPVAPAGVGEDPSRTGRTE